MRGTCDRCRPINKGVHTLKINREICASTGGKATAWAGHPLFDRFITQRSDRQATSRATKTAQQFL